MKAQHYDLKLKCKETKTFHKEMKVMRKEMKLSASKSSNRLLHILSLGAPLTLTFAYRGG